MNIYNSWKNVVYFKLKIIKDYSDQLCYKPNNSQNNNSWLDYSVSNNIICIVI